MKLIAAFLELTRMRQRAYDCGSQLWRSKERNVKGAFVASLICLANANTIIANAREVFIRGSGQASCAEWLGIRADGGTPALVVQHWVLGYVTSYNVHGLSEAIDVAGQIDAGKLYENIDNWCQDNPRKSLESAVGTLIDVWKLQFQTR